VRQGALFIGILLGSCNRPGYLIRGSGRSIFREDRVDFSWALEEVKNGERITRSGWNGRGMFVVLQKGYPDGIGINKNTAEALKIAEGTPCSFLPYLLFRTAGGQFVPWLASQTDLLAEDWETL
jgi:hypothetical protein